MKFITLFLFACSAFLVTSCGPTGTYDNVPSPGAANGGGAPVDAATSGRTAGKPLGYLAAGDIISINYPGAPEFNQKQKIRRNNRVSLPMIGEVLAGGKELKAFQKELSRRYTNHLQNPNVVVKVEVTAATVYVSGYVEKPSKITLDRPMTALEAIMEAGGFNKYGSPKKVSVVRNENGVYRRYRLNLDAAMKGEARPFSLRPNDVIRAR